MNRLAEYSLDGGSFWYTSRKSKINEIIIKKKIIYIKRFEKKISNKKFILPASLATSTEYKLMRHK